MTKLDDIVKVITIDAPIEKVWEKVSSSEGIAEWFMPNDFKPELGYEFHLQSPFGPSPCKVTELDPPYRLSFLWDDDGWAVSFLLKEMDGKTEFTLVHAGWKDTDEILPKAREASGIVRERMSGGWSGIVEKLKKAVEA